MRMYDLIEKKKRGETLTREEISYMVRGYVDGTIPDYQMSAMLMAVYFQGMGEQETSDLTLEMAHSGEMVDLSPIGGIKADKHSTGGVGDKTTLIAGPVAAACGVRVAKMSGRGLGHTGGTIDKLESIPGFRTSISREEFFRLVNENGIAVIGQSGNLVPADKKLYSLRDVTATVDSIPLIASSIMSKKLAAGSDAIVLDVKMGSGAFMKDLESATALAKERVGLAVRAGRRCCALITNMDIPLGMEIGNLLEMKEAALTLSGRGPEDLKEVSLELAANMMFLARIGELDECRRMAREALESGAALRTLAAMVRGQGGDESWILHPEQMPQAEFKLEAGAESSGYIASMDTEAIGIASVMLGAGRSTKEDTIDCLAGITLKKKYGDRVEAGETIAVLQASDESLLKPAAQKLLSAVSISETRPEEEPLVYKCIHDTDGNSSALTTSAAQTEIH